jgi:hypothetical protein
VAFPVDAARIDYDSEPENLTTHPVTYPAGIVAGNLLACIIRSANGSTFTFPAGWNMLVNNDTSDASDDTTSIAWRKADGTEGASFNVTSPVGTFVTAITWRITGAADPTVQPPQLSTIAVGASTTPNPTTCTPTGGAKDYLWIWMGGWEGEQTSPPASQPTNYDSTKRVGASNGTTGSVASNCRCAGVSRQNNAASEDAAAWTISVSDQWSAWVMAIHPELDRNNDAKKMRIRGQAINRGASW